MNNQTLRKRSMVMWVLVSLPILWLFAVITSPDFGIFQVVSFALLLIAGAVTFHVLTEMLWHRGVGNSQNSFWQPLYKSLSRALGGYAVCLLAAVLYGIFQGPITAVVAFVVAIFGVWWVLSGMLNVLEQMYEGHFNRHQQATPAERDEQDSAPQV